MRANSAGRPLSLTARPTDENRRRHRGEEHGVAVIGRLRRETGIGLVEGNFEKVSANGFGDPYNAYAHSMAWFRDHLYVGTSRNNFVMVKVTIDDGVRLANPDVWPVNCPGDLQQIMNTLRAEIWRFDPRSRDWKRAYVAPLVESPSGMTVPTSVSFRAMAVFQGTSDEAPALYVPTRPTSHTPVSVMLRSGDGERFCPVSEPGLGLPDPKPKGIRALTAYKGRLFAAPSEGPTRGQGNIAAVMSIVVSADPSRGGWRLACEPAFGDPGNKTVFAMEEFNGHLYAGTVNIAHGYQVWKTAATGDPPYRWERVLSNGAFRGRLNQIAMTMTRFGDHLYVGSAIQGFRDNENDIGPAPPEIVRLHADDTWDLVAGEARSTPDGFKVPLSGMGPGFGNRCAGYIWQMCVHDGHLYAGNSVWSPLIKYTDPRRWSRVVREMFTPDALEGFLRDYGGFDLWRTANGTDWHPVTRGGFGNQYNIGCRTMASTPYGLFVGCVNPFGPEVAMRRVGGWRYESNPRGGLEVWLGAPATLDDPDASTPPAPPPGPLAVRAEPAGPDVESERWIEDYFGGSDFRLCGFWTCQTHDARAACENLVDEMLSLFAQRDGMLCDAGCGMGATTRHLLRHFAQASITGITTRRNLRRCRQNAPGVRFLASRLPRVRCPSRSFDKVLCFEGAGLRGSVPLLWRELARILRPGGQLVGSRIILRDEAAAGDASAGPTADGISRQRDLLLASGFESVTVLDTTRECWTMSLDHRRRHLWMRRLALEIEADVADRVLERLGGGDDLVEAYVLFSAMKPAGGPDVRGTPEETPTAGSRPEDGKDDLPLVRGPGSACEDAGEAPALSGASETTPAPERTTVAPLFFSTEPSRPCSTMEASRSSPFLKRNSQP